MHDSMKALGFRYKLLACFQHRKNQDSIKADDNGKNLACENDGNIAQKLSFPLYGQD